MLNSLLTVVHESGLSNDMLLQFVINILGVFIGAFLSYIVTMRLNKKTEKNKLILNSINVCCNVLETKKQSISKHQSIITKYISLNNESRKNPTVADVVEIFDVIINDLRELSGVINRYNIILGKEFDSKLEDKMRTVHQLVAESYEDVLHLLNKINTALVKEHKNEVHTLLLEYKNIDVNALSDLIFSLSSFMRKLL